ncbi:MAG: hypothetical protein IKX33_05255 [Prevotella sp.]|nr:hypothetical protein [Prevotella sp.]
MKLHYINAAHAGGLFWPARQGKGNPYLLNPTQKTVTISGKSARKG